MLQVCYSLQTQVIKSQVWATILNPIVFCQATAEANNLTAVAGAKDMYSKNMEQVRKCFLSDSLMPLLSFAFPEMFLFSFRFAAGTSHTSPRLTWSAVTASFVTTR